MREGFAGVLSSVGAGKHRHHFANYSITDNIWETTDHRPANISIHGLVNEWSLSKSVKDLRNFGKELGAETNSLRLVPELRFSHIKFGGATNLDIEAQRSSRSRRAFTSDHGL
jgi:hypothetical protein